ncbi:hypothetical protein B0I37DRAFT_194731 [Chaetomium sp. MPI-CAGE-AT-0009]|nr:hypothetical protein B0I37DRAFT_194731 [Chaetomium sp. MPI-CAGE-AT-0009]
MHTVPTGWPARKRPAWNGTGQDLRPTSLFSACWPAGKGALKALSGSLLGVAPIRGCFTVFLTQSGPTRGESSFTGECLLTSWDRHCSRRGDLALKPPPCFPGGRFTVRTHAGPWKRGINTVFHRGKCPRCGLRDLFLEGQNQKILPFAAIGASLLTTGTNRKHQDHVRASNSPYVPDLHPHLLLRISGFRLITSSPHRHNSLCAVNGTVSPKAAARCRCRLFSSAFDGGSFAALARRLIRLGSHCPVSTPPSLSPAHRWHTVHSHMLGPWIPK